MQTLPEGENLGWQSRNKRIHIYQQTHTETQNNSETHTKSFYWFNRSSKTCIHWNPQHKDVKIKNSYNFDFNPLYRLVFLNNIHLAVIHNEHKREEIVHHTSKTKTMTLSMTETHYECIMQCIKMPLTFNLNNALNAC